MKNRTGSKKLTTNTYKVLGRQKIRKGHGLSSGSDIVTDLRFRPLAWAVAVAAGGQMLLAPGFASAEQIKTDGRTKTTLEIQGNVTDVRTGTIRGLTAFNSFSKFDVYRGNVVNLHVPGKAQNLLNVVNSANPSHIDGVLNSIKNGGIGGNVYIANTAGVVIGAEGQVNVGALTVVTPTREVMDGFFDASGNPSDASTQAIIDRTVAISSEGHVTVKGKINAKGNVNIAAGSVTNSGVIQSGAVYAGNAPDFSDIVNVADMETGTHISIENGDIEIVAESDITNTGIIATEGANNLDGGDIHLTAGNDITVSGNAKIAASGHGENSDGGNVIIMAEQNSTLKDAASIQANAGATGDGGFVEFSAKDTVNIQGGAMHASASVGESGTVLIDPTDINWTGSGSDQYTHGTNYVLEATNSIVLDNVSLSSRVIAGSDTRANHLNDASTGNSGDITLKAKKIELKNGTQLLAHGGSTTTGTVKLEARDASVLPSLGWATAVAQIDVENSTIKGNNVKLDAQSKINSQFVYDNALLSLDSNDNITTASADVIGQSLLNLGSTVLQQLGQFLLSLGGVQLVVSDVDAAAHVNIKSGAIIESATDVTLTADTVTAAGMAKVLPTPGAQINTPLGIGALYVRDAADASTSIASGATITSQNLLVSAHNNASMEGTIASGNNQSANSNFTAVAGSFTRADVNASSIVNSGATLNISNGLTVAATNVGKYSNEVTSATGPNGRAAAAVAVADTNSSATASLNANVKDATHVSVYAINDVKKDITVAQSKVGGSELDNIIAAGKRKVVGMGMEPGTGGVVEQALFNYLGLSNKAPANAASPTQQKFRIGGAIAYNNSTHNATATIGDNAKVHASGDVVVASRIRAENMKTAASAAAISTSSERPQASDTARMAFAVGAAIGNYTHNVLARIGNNADITAQRIGVSADTIIPLRDSLLFGSAGSVNAWTRWTGLDTITNTLSTLTDITDVFNGESSATATSDGSDGSIGLSGAVNMLEYTDNTRSVVDTGAKLNITGSQTGAWSRDVVVQPDIPHYILGVLVSTELQVNEHFDYTAPVNILANHDATLLFMAGKFIPSGTGAKGLGASVGIVDLNDITEAIVREGAIIRGVNETSDAAASGKRTWTQGSTHAAESVVVQAKSEEHIISLGESAGFGTSYGANGVYTQMTHKTATHALIDNEADISAKKLKTLAEATPVIFSISGALNYTGGVSVGLGSAINDVSGDTRAEIADNDTWSIDGNARSSQVTLTTNTIKTPNLTVEARTGGHLEAIAVTGAVSNNSPDAPGTTGAIGKLKNKWYAALNYASGKADLTAAGGGATVAQPPPKKPEIGFSGAGSLAMNFTDIATDAKVVGVTVDQAHTYDSGAVPSLTVRAVQDSDIIAATGAAAITRSNPASAQTKSASISGSVAVNSIGNSTLALLKDTVVTSAHDLYVQALSGGEQLAVAIGMAVDLSAAPKSFSLVGSASVTLAQTDDNDETKNKTVAKVEDSSITGEAGAGRDMEVTAYNRTYIGTGGGSLTVSKGASTAKGATVGGAISWAEVRNDVTSGVYNTDITSLDNLAVRAYNAAEIGSGAAMLTVSPSAQGVTNISGTLVANQILNHTTAEIDNSDNINVTGNVEVLASDRGADSALETLIDPSGKRNNTAKGLDYCGESAGGPTPSGNCIVAVAGTVQLGKGANYGVSVAYNTIDNNVTSRINQSTVVADDISVKATSDTSILGIGFGVAGSSTGFSGAGSVSIADIGNKVNAKVEGASTVLTAPDIAVKATDDSKIKTVAGQVNVALKGSALGAAVTYNNIANEARAVVDGARLNASSTVDIHAKENAEIQSLAAAGGLAKDTGVSISGSLNFIDNTTEAGLKNGSIHDNASGQNTVKIRAEDTSVIKSLAGSVGFGMQAGAGAAFALNRIGSNVHAYVQNATVNAANVLQVLADSTSTLWSMAAAVGLGRDGFAGSLAINDIGQSSFYGNEANTVTAEISDSTINNGNGATIKVHAKDSSDIRSVAGAVAVGVNSTAIGAAIAQNRIHSDVKARVADTTLANANTITLEGINTSSIKTLSASGTFGGELGFSGSESANKIGNKTTAELEDSEITGSTADVTVSADDTATIDALAGGAAFSGSGVAAGLAIAANRIDSTTTANVSGKKNAGYAVKSLDVLADATATIRALSISLAGSGGAAVAGNLAINLIDSTTKAFIDKGAVVVAENNVGVLAESDDRISIASGTAGIAYGAPSLGVGASFTINKINGDTTAYIGDDPATYSGSATNVTALAKNAGDTVTFNDGGLTSNINLGQQVDLAQYNKLDLNALRHKTSINGLVVNASSTEQIENIGTNVATGGVAAGVIENISVTGGNTQAYILNANINSDNTGAGASQKVVVNANNIAYDNSFVGNVAIGAGSAVGIGADIHAMSRLTRAYTAGGSIKARNSVDVNALATQGISSLAVGASIGAIGGAGTLSLALFNNTTEAFSKATSIQTGNLTISADNDNNLYQVGGVLAGGGSGVGGTFVVASSDSTTTAYSQDETVQATGNVNITADNSTDIHHVAVTVAGGGAYGVAGMASVNLITDKTNAYVSNSDIGSSTNRAASIKVKANHNLAIDSKSGALGFGYSAVGVGAGASVNIVKAQTTAQVQDSDLYSTGQTQVAAYSVKDVDATAMTAGIGSTAGIGGAAVVTLVGDDVRDEGADEVSGTLTAANGLTNDDRFSQYNTGDAEDPLSGADRDSLNYATQKSVTDVSSSAGGYTFRTAAEVKGSSTINAGSIDIDAKDKTDTKTLVGGFGVGALGLGGGVAVTTVKANVAATVAQAAGITSSGAITVNALADNDNGKTVDIFALAGGAGLVGLGAAVGYADVSNHVDAYLANGANATGANVTITATDNTDVTVDAKGAAVGAAAVGVVISDATKSSTVNAGIGGTVTASGVTVAASNGGKVEAISQSAAGGIQAAGNGAQATAGEIVTVNAYSANSTTFNLGAGALAVTASSTPQVSARADGVSVSGGYNVGVSIADASVNEQVNAYLGGSNTVNAGNLTVSAKQLRNNGAETAKSNAFAAGGGLLVGISATNSRADATIALNSHVGSNSTLNVTGTSNVTATIDSKQHADVDGYNGGMLAVGFNDAYATSNTQTLAYLDAGVTTNQSAATLNVSATGTDDNYADATSGAGGIVSGAGANATTYTASVTKAYIGDPNASVTKNLILKNLAVTADHTSRFNGKVNSTNASLFGGSGAYANNTVNSTVQANLGSKLNIVAETVDINANNRVRKDDLPGDNVVSGSGGVVDLPATKSESHVSTDTDVTIGNDTLITSILPNAALGRIVMNALNDLAMSDSAKLDSGGAVAVAKAESYIYVDKSDADITVGAGTVLSSDETIRLESKTLANVVTRVDAKTYGLAGAAQGYSSSSINSKNNISLNGARLVSLKDVVLTAGHNNVLNADSETRLWNKTAIPMSTSPEADGLVSQSNIITVNGYAPTGGVIPAGTNPDPTAVQAQAAAIATKGDVYLKAGKGTVTTRGYGRGTDLYRQLIADAAKLFGANISLDTTGGRTEDNSGSGLVVNGTVFSGTHWQQLLHIFADANGNATTNTMSDGWDPTAVALSGDRLLSRYYAERIAALDSLYQQFRYTNPDAANGYLADKQILEAKQAQSAGVSVKFYEIGKGITAESSNIYAYGDSLTGAGKLIAPGDTKIEIINDTKHFLSVKKLAGISTLSIEDELGGVINFNGVSVSNNADVARVNKNNVTSSFSIVKDRTNSADPLINLKNTFEYAVSGNGKVNPEIHIFGDVTNRRGTIRVESTGSVEVGGNLNGKTIDIKTKGDFVKLFTPGFTHTAGDDTLNLYTTACPVALSAGQCLISRDAKGNFITGNTLFTKDMYYEYLARLAYLPNPDAVPGDRDGFSQNQQWTDNSSYHAPGYVPGSTIAGGNVFISAEKLNINGLIQSGYSDYNVAIDQAKSDQIVAAGGNWVQLENDKESFFAPKAKWNAATNSMELTSIQVGGGYIQLYGDIFSTGNGQLKVMDGYGHITINNTSNRALTANKLDTGLGAAGKIQITDTSSKDNRGNSLVTTITQLGGVTSSTSKYENTGDYFRADFVSSGLTDKKGVYNTREARRLNWVDVQLYNLTYVGSYETSCYGGCSWGLGDSLSVDPGSTSKSSSDSAYSARTGGMPPNGESLSQDSQWYSGYAIPDYRMDMKKTTSAVTVTPLPVQKWWTDTCVVGICVDDVEHIKTSIQYTWMETFNFNHSLNASKGINVEFIGHDTGALAVNSAAALNLTNTVRNLKGTTTLSGTSINSVGANAQVIAQNLVMNATAGSIGSVLAPLKIDLQTAGTLTANATNNIALWEQTGDLNVVRAYGGASDTDTVWLKSDGDIVNGAVINTDAVRGGNIQLLSDNGAIGTGAKAMLINTTSTAGDVSAAADSDIYLTERTGDLRIQDISALAGNVTLTALNGSITDSNANATVDMETQQALLDVAARAGLQGSAAQVSADSTIRAYNLARQTEYQKYWQMRQLHRDANGAYQYNDYDAGFVYQLTDADRTAFASRPPAEVNQYVARQTTLYHTVYQRLNPAQAGDVAYDANYRYDVAAMDAGMFAKLTEGNAWTDSEILNRVGAGIFKDTPDTEVMIEEANVRGKNITMTASTGGIGRQTGAVVISAANPDVWTNAERLALVAADRSDVMIDWDAKTISINQKDDLDITAQAGSVLNANALNGIYIGSEADIGVARVEATSATADVRIKTAGSLINAATTGVAAVKGNNLTLEAGGGNLGSFTKEFLVDQTAGGSIVARAKDDLYLRNLSGDMMIDQVYAGGLAKLTSVGAIKEAPSLASPNGDLQTDIQASRVSLKAATTIGETDVSRLKYLDVATALGGRLDAVAPNGVYVYGSGGVLGLGDISSVNGEVAIDTFADGLTILGKVVSRNSVAFNVGGGILFGESGQLSSVLGDVSLRANGYLLDENADPLDPQRYGVKMLGESSINAPKGSISISSKYDMLVGSLTALKGISLSSDTGSVADGGTSPVNVTSLTGSVGIAGKAIDLKGISAGGAVDLQAGKGGIVIHDVLDAGKSVSANTTGDLDINQLVSASGDVELIAAGDLGINNASTAGLLFLQAGTAATPGNITAGTLYVGGASDLGASGTLAITGLLNSVGDVALAANGIALNSVTTAGQATLLAGTQGVNVSGLIDSDGDIDVLSNGNVDINSLASANGNNTITSTAGDVTVDQITSVNGSATVTSTAGDINLGTVTTQGDLQLNGLAVTLDSGTAGGAATVTAGVGGVTILDSLVASADALVNAAGDIAVSQLTSLNGNNTVISTAGDVLIDQITADGNNTITSTAGDVSIEQLTSLNGDNTVSSTTGDVSIGQLTADNGGATLTAAAGTVNVDALSTAADLDVNAVGVTLGTGYVGGALDITAGIGGVTLDDITAWTAADVSTSGNIDIVQQLTTIVGGVNLSGVGIAVQNLFSGTTTQLLAGAGGVQINGFLNSENNIDVTSGAGIAVNQVVSNTGDITMLANDAIVNVNASGDINVDGGNITLASLNSTLGQPGIRLVGRSTGSYDLQAATGIYFEDRSLNFNGSVFTSAGLVDLYVAGASSAKVAAPKAALMMSTMSLSSSSMRSASFMAPMMAPPSGTVHLSSLTGPVINFSGGSLIVDYVNGGEVTLGATDQGGSVTVGQAFVSGSMTINADNINLPYVEYTGDNGLLPIYLSGGTRPMAEQVDIYVAPKQDPMVVFHGLSANNATVNADVTRLRFVDTVIGQVAILGNRFYKAVVDNVHKVLYGEELQLFTQQTPFNLDFYAEQKFDLNYAFGGDYRWSGAAIIDYNPDFIVNEFSTENSATLLAPKMLTLNDPVPGSEWDGVLLETGHLQQLSTVVIVDGALAAGSCIANPSLVSGDACTESVSAIEVIN